MKLPHISIAFIAALVAAATPAAGEESARELMNRVTDSAPASLKASSSLVTSSGQKRDMTVSHKRLGEGAATYIEVIAPGDVAGTRFLLKEKSGGADEQYMYIPAVKRAIKVSEETRKQPFLGSDFYVADLVSPDLDAYELAFTGEEEVGGRKTRLIEAKPKDPEGELYGKAIFAVDAADLVIVRTEFFDKKGAPLKVLTTTKLEQVDGKWTPLEQQMKNLQSDTTSTLAVREVTYGIELPDGMFDRSFLLQERGS